MLNESTMSLICDRAPGFVHHWPYTEHGRPVMVVARYEYNNKKTYRQFTYEDGTWREGVASTLLPLFGLSSLSNSSPISAISICEGEKSTSVIHQLTWPALSTPLGAESVSRTDFSPIRHFAQFIIFRDNDKAGANFAREVATAIKKMRPDAQIMVCNLVHDLSAGDIVDWVQRYPLCGGNWDGYSAFTPQQRARVSEALQAAIKDKAIAIEECPQVRFKVELSLFDGDPLPIQTKLRGVPPFPLELLPESLRHYLQLFARQMSIPVDFPATTLLALVGGIVGRAVRLTMRAGHGWEEVANIWAVLIGPPSSKKSPTLRRLSRALLIVENNAKAEFEIAIKRYRELKKQAENAKVPFDLPEPILKRIMTDDCTIPKLRELLSQNTRGLILRSDELKGQLEKFDRDGNEGDRSFLMQSWAGLDLYNEDRIARGSCIQIPLTVTWIGCTQPTSLTHYLRHALGEAKGADGLWQRFQMMTYPDFETNYTICREEMPAELDAMTTHLFTKLDEESSREPRYLAFSKEAQENFDQWHVALETNCRCGEHQPHWESHLGKQPKLIAALCIILHRLCEVITKSEPLSEVPLDTWKAAEKLVQYYQEHAQRCYASVESGEVADARKILEFVKKKKLPARFKAVDIYRNGLGGIGDSQRVLNALRLLQELNCVAQEKVYGQTGRGAEFWVTHPKLLE